MKMRWATVAVAAEIVVLAGCVPAVMGPTVSATPGPGKLPALFASDHAACTAQANQQLAPVVQAANNQVAGTALLNVMTGTGADAVAVNAQATATLQQQYDAAYTACMYAKGDNVPPYYMQPTYYAEPAPVHHARKRVVHKPAVQPPATASAPAPGSGFVVPAPASAPAGGSGFVTPAATMTTGAGAVAATPTASSGRFAVPPAHP